MPWQDPSFLLAIGMAGLLGCFIGSFLNVCVHRLPRGESVVHPPSRCYACGTRLTWHDNLPVIGWLLLRGRCRWCGTPFSVRYLLAELAVGGLSAAAAAFAWTQPNPWAGALPGPVVLGLALMPMLVLAWFVYVASVIDLDHQIIPDELTKPMQLLAPFLVMGIGCNVAIEEPLPQQWLLRVDVFGVMTPTPLHLLAWMGGIGVGIIALLLLSVPLARWVYSRFTAQAPWSDDDHRGFRTGVWWFCACTVIQLVALAALLVFTPGGWWGLASLILAQAILGSLAGWCSLYLIGLLGTMAFRRNAMGFGDVKFLAPIGAFLGPLGVVYAFFAAAIIGTCIGVPLRILKSTREIPFGPYLAAGAIAVLVAGGWFHARLLNGILP